MARAPCLQSAAGVICDIVEKILAIERSESAASETATVDRTESVEWLELFETLWRISCSGGIPAGGTAIVSEYAGSDRKIFNDWVIEWIKRVATHAELILSVCTGALLLAKADLLDGLEATTHHGAVDLLRQVAPQTVVHADRRLSLA